jgi:hypothetical protein
MNLIGLMIFFSVYKIERPVHLKERFRKATSPASRLGGSYCGICGKKNVTLIVFYSEGFNFILPVIIPP